MSSPFNESSYKFTHMLLYITSLCIPHAKYIINQYPLIRSFQTASKLAGRDCLPVVSEVHVDC